MSKTFSPKRKSEEKHEQRVKMSTNVPLVEENDDIVATQEYAPDNTSPSDTLYKLGCYKKDGVWYHVCLSSDISNGDPQLWETLKCKLRVQFPDSRFSGNTPYTHMFNGPFIDWLGTPASEKSGVLSFEWSKVTLAYKTTVNNDGDVEIFSIYTTNTPDTEAFKELITKLKDENMYPGSRHIVVSDVGEKSGGFMEMFCNLNGNTAPDGVYMLGADIQDTINTVLVYDANIDEHVQQNQRPGDIMPNNWVASQSISIHYHPSD
jgi:hypothetical protein